MSLRYAFSAEPEHELAKGCRYVGDRIRHDQEEVQGLWEQGARVYMCGSRKVQEGVKEVVRGIFDEVAREKGWSGEVLEEEREKFRKNIAGRAVSDVFD